MTVARSRRGGTSSSTPRRCSPPTARPQWCFPSWRSASTPTAMPAATAATAATGSDGKSPFRARPACSTWRSASTCRCCAANGRVHDTSWRRAGARTETAGRLHGYLGEVPPDLSITIHVDLGDYECYGIVHTACIGVERDQSMTQRLSATEYVPPGLTKTKRRCENPCAGGG